MTEGIESSRVLALDLRPRVCGYAAFEGRRLVDWGTIRCKPNNRFLHGLARVDRTVRPEILVLRRITASSQRSRPSTRAITRLARNFARHRGWVIEHVTEAALERVFGRFSRRTKEQIAAALVEWYPELAPRLPPHRKLWKPQDWRMPIFDAAALAVTFMAASYLERFRRPPADE